MRVVLTDYFFLTSHIRISDMLEINTQSVFNMHEFSRIKFCYLKYLSNRFNFYNPKLVMVY